MWSSYSGSKYPGVFVRVDWVSVIGDEDLVFKNGKQIKWAAAKAVDGA